MQLFSKKRKKTRIDLFQLLLVILSLFLISYSLIYIYNYYSYNEILKSFPDNYNTKNEKLAPNEIGDSIGGTLNPIIGITASILTFLAFYIQYKSNKQQVRLFKKQIRYERKKDYKKREERHKITLTVFVSLISQMLLYYKETGDNLSNFIENEKKKPLYINKFKFLTDASYVYFKELNFTEIYEAMIWYFNFQLKTSENWEEEFTETLNRINFYDKLISDLKEKYLTHVKSKSINLNDIGSKLDESMGEILSDNSFSNENESPINGIDDYMRIVHNQDENGNIITKNFEGTDFEDLQVNFFGKFLDRLFKQKNFLEYLTRKKQGFIYNDNPEIKRIRSILDYFSVLNKKIGNERMQTHVYLENLEEIFSNYFSEENQQLKSISNFLSKIDIK